jgi:hypothetical protein
MNRKYKKVKEDRFLTVYSSPDMCKLTLKGKRLPNNCPFTHEEVRLYVTNGAVAMVKAVMNRTGKGLTETWNWIRDYKNYKRSV